MVQNQYIKAVEFDQIMKDLNYESCEESGKKSVLDRATADLEADLAEKFVVPLVPRLPLTLYTECPAFARNKVLNAMRAKIKEIIGFDKNRTLTGTIDSSDKFINVHGIEYRDQIRSLLKPVVDYQFRLLNQAEEATTPVQHLGLSRANNTTDPFNGGWNK